MTHLISPSEDATANQGESCRLRMITLRAKKLLHGAPTGRGRCAQFFFAIVMLVATPLFGENDAKLRRMQDESFTARLEFIGSGKRSVLKLEWLALRDDPDCNVIATIYSTEPDTSISPYPGRNVAIDYLPNVSKFSAEPIELYQATLPKAFREPILEQLNALFSDLRLGNSQPVNPNDLRCHLDIGFNTKTEISIHQPSNPRRYEMCRRILEAVARKFPEPAVRELTDFSLGQETADLKETQNVSEFALEVTTERFRHSGTMAFRFSQASPGKVSLSYSGSDGVTLKSSLSKADANVLLKDALRSERHLSIDSKFNTMLNVTSQSTLVVNDYPHGSGFQLTYNDPIDFERSELPRRRKGYLQAEALYKKMLTHFPKEDHASIFLPATDEEIRIGFEELSTEVGKLRRKMDRQGKTWEGLVSTGIIPCPTDLTSKKGGTKFGSLMQMHKFPAESCRRMGIEEIDTWLLVVTAPDADYEGDSRCGAIALFDPRTKKCLDIWRPTEPIDFYECGEITGKSHSEMGFGQSLAFSPDGMYCIVGCRSGGKAFFHDLKRGTWTTLRHDLFLPHVKNNLGRWVPDHSANVSGLTRGLFFGNKAFTIAAVVSSTDAVFGYWDGTGSAKPVVFCGNSEEPSNIFPLHPEPDKNDRSYPARIELTTRSSRVIDCLKAHRLLPSIPVTEMPFFCNPTKSGNGSHLFNHSPLSASGMYDIGRISPEGAIIKTFHKLPEKVSGGVALGKSGINLEASLVSGNRCILGLAISSAGLYSRVLMTSGDNNHRTYPLEHFDPFNGYDNYHRPVDMGWVEKDEDILWMSTVPTMAGFPPTLLLVDWPQKKVVKVYIDELTNSRQQAYSPSLKEYYVVKGNEILVFNITEPVSRLWDGSRAKLDDQQ